MRTSSELDAMARELNNLLMQAHGIVLELLEEGVSRVHACTSCGWPTPGVLCANCLASEEDDLGTDGR